MVSYSICPHCRQALQCDCRDFKEWNQNTRRSMQILSGGGLVTLLPDANAYSTPQTSPSVQLAFLLPVVVQQPVSPFGAPSQAFFAAPQAAGQFVAQPSQSLFGLPPPQRAVPPPQRSPPLVQLDEPVFDAKKHLLSIVVSIPQCGWYYPRINYIQAQEMLKGTAMGTFLIRDSSDPSFLFSLTFKLRQGIASVRLFSGNGFFRLTSPTGNEETLPKFNTVMELIQYYQRPYVPGDRTRMVISTEMLWQGPLILVQPLRRKPPTLKHLARLAIHGAIKGATLPKVDLMPPPHTQLELPGSLIAYLSEYPHSV